MVYDGGTLIEEFRDKTGTSGGLTPEDARQVVVEWLTERGFVYGALDAEVSELFLVLIEEAER